MSGLASRRTVRLLAAGALLGMVAVPVTVGAVRARAPRTLAPPAAPAAGELLKIEAELETWTRAASIDRHSAMFPAKAAVLYLQRGRLTGDHGDALEAERHARRSLALRTQHNAGAFVTLAASLLEQHRFREANDIARQLLAGQPDVDAYKSLLGETQLELGDYAGAHASFSSIRSPSSTLSTMAGLARWSELQGDDRTALRLLGTARLAAQRRPGEMLEEIAWYHMREADIQLRGGRERAAAAALAAGLALAPTDYRLLAARARLAAARGEWREAAAFGEASTYAVVDPATLAIVATAYGELGDSAKAREVERAARSAMSGQAGSLHRAWALYHLDRGQHVDSIAGVAHGELATRRDVQTLDVLAWAELKRGRPSEASRHVREALAPGFREPGLLYRSGFVLLAAGDTARAEALLTRALAADPHSSPLYARDARLALRRIDAGRDPRRGVADRTIARARRAVQALDRAG